MLIYRGSFSVFSTSVEVILSMITCWHPCFSILHECGGDPNAIQDDKGNYLYSPRVWRWSLKLNQTTAEINSILHECGGDPTCSRCSGTSFQYSPRVWRWSYGICHHHKGKSVFSTSVEVIPPTPASETKKNCILHECGGDPQQYLESLFITLYSPRVWRWSLDTNPSHYKDDVFSTSVEVILGKLFVFKNPNCILHECGGDPGYKRAFDTGIVYSPRVWRWSWGGDAVKSFQNVFSTSVEVIPV